MTQTFSHTIEMINFQIHNSLRRRILSVVCLFVFILLVTSSIGSTASGQTTVRSHISSSNSGGDVFNGVNINNLLGAERFYNAGYSGDGAIIGNIEAGHVYNNHAVLQHVTTQVTGTGALGTVRNHATWVTHAISGRVTPDNYSNTMDNYFEYGIAKQSETWSGAIATAFLGGNSFQVTNASVASTYSGMLITGVSGETVDIFNSSWGYTAPTGDNVFAIGVDGMINATGKIGVLSAGNSGPGANTVGGIGAGYNSITVGALRADTDATPYNRISSFSSRSPNDFYDALNDTTISGVRAAVDIVAPGQHLTLAANGTTNSYNTNLAGTSFSAPIVAGGAGLVVDAGKDLYAGNASAIDGRVVKAVLLNGADKLPGWDNGQADVSGIITTVQSLDYTFGAGRMNLSETFDQYVSTGNGGLAGTADVAGTGQGDLGNVSAIGWDFGEVDANDSNFYFIDEQLMANSDMTLTLTWFADTDSGDLDDFDGFAYEHLADLNLRVFEFDNLTDRNIVGTIAESISLYNVVEHLNFIIASQGFYGIEVIYEGSHWNFTGETGEMYGLAWYGTGSGTGVPEPGSTAFFGVLTISICYYRRRRKKAKAIKRLQD